MRKVPINLFTQFYLEPNDERFEELLYCIYKHQLGRYNKVTLLVENDETQLFCERNFLEYRIVNIGKRANFNDFFRLLEQEENKHSFNIICNTDIFFPAPLQINHFYDNHRNYSPSKTVLALSRYDFNLDGTTTRFHRPDSQDAWIFYGNPSIRIELDYGMGIAGCISGDAIVKINRGKRDGSRAIRLDELYMKFNNIPTKKKPFVNKEDATRVLSYDISTNRLEYKKIKNVIQSGVKETIKITFDDNTSLQLTKDHRVMDEFGQYKRAENFIIGDSVISSNNQKARKLIAKRKYRKRIVVYVKYHPFAEKKIVKGREYTRVKRCRLVLEANLNNMGYEEFIGILKNDKIRSEKLKFYDPKLEVHHKNMDTTCDDLENLEIVDKKTHAKHHANQDNFNFLPVKPKQIVRIEESGNVMTYDIEMESEPHNFTVNDIIVHNCDNRIAYDLQMQGFDLINPCTHIHAYHYHVSGVRNYLDSNNEPKQRIPPPYYLLNPF